MNQCKKVSLVLAILLSSLHLIYPQHMDWSDLRTGKEKVGYKSCWEIDYSRVIVYNEKKINRPIMINVWYPAKEYNDTSMPYKDYFDIESKRSILKKITNDYKEYNLSVLSYQMIGKPVKNLNRIEKRALNNFLDQKITVKKDAILKEGKFPLIIYHQGFEASFEDNALLAQFLASNGYVVIGSSFFKENTDKSLGIDGREQSVQDIQFLINYASKLENLDISNIALIGHSGGAQASILAKSNTSNSIKAVVSIETTQETFGLSDPRWNNFTKPVLEQLSNVNGSILAFTNHKAVFQLYDLMSLSNRYYITFPETLNHNEYISQGIFSNHLNFEIKKNEQLNLSNQIDEINEDRLNYIKVNNYTLDFIQWKLKGIKPLKETFKEDEYNKSINLNLPFVQAVPIGKNSPISYSFNSNKLPTPRQVWKMVRSNNTDSLMFTLIQFKNIHSGNPIYNDIFAFALISQLIEEKKLDDARQLFSFYEKEKIPVTKRFISLGKFSIMLQNEDYAKRCFSNLLKLDSDNQEAKKELKRLKTKYN
ncbi:MAG: hypothetical protein AAGH46_00190 [Bacteroidota bacterium]